MIRSRSIRRLGRTASRTLCSANCRINMQALILSSAAAAAARAVARRARSEASSGTVAAAASAAAAAAACGASVRAFSSAGGSSSVVDQMIAYARKEVGVAVSCCCVGVVALLGGGEGEGETSGTARHKVAHARSSGERLRAAAVAVVCVPFFPTAVRSYKQTQRTLWHHHPKTHREAPRRSTSRARGSRCSRMRWPAPTRAACCSCWRS